jgi:uncharacterized protein
MSMAAPQAPGQFVIDVAEFARLGKVFAGEVGVGDFPRLQDLIVAGQERLHYKVQGALTIRREAQITCIIRGSVLLECQRCLGTFNYAIDISSGLVFVTDESQLPPIEEEDELVDYVVAEKVANLLAIIEDEIILALPLAPRHEGGCGESARQQGMGEKPSSFAALNKLK